MRSNKRYTNTTISKRVDHESARAVRRAVEPLLCERCGAVYIHRRWTKPESLRKNEKHVRWHPNQKVTCPACKQQLEGEPAGFVYIAGEFLYSHREEIERLIENEAARAGQDNPLARIMKIERKESDGITVTTTTEHLAQRLGHALEKAFSGEVRYDFSHENKLARVWWHRD